MATTPRRVGRAAGCTCDHGWREVPGEPIPGGLDPDTGEQIWITPAVTVKRCQACNPKPRPDELEQPF